MGRWAAPTGGQNGNMTEQDRAGSLEAHLHEQIPISQAMGIRVVAADQHAVSLCAPLEPNVNHRNTVFGGSCASVAILAAWSLVYIRATSTAPVRVVIQHAATDYLLPIEGPFEATCRVDDEEAWAKFTRTLRRRGRARITVNTDVIASDRVVARFEGTYVAVGGEVESSA